MATDRSIPIGTSEATVSTKGIVIPANKPRTHISTQMVENINSTLQAQGLQACWSPRKEESPRSARSSKTSPSISCPRSRRRHTTSIGSFPPGSTSWTRTRQEDNIDDPNFGAELKGGGVAPLAAKHQIRITTNVKEIRRCNGVKNRIIYYSTWTPVGAPGGGEGAAGRELLQLWRVLEHP